MLIAKHKRNILQGVMIVERKIEKKSKQGWIHGYPSRLRVGRCSDEIDQPSSWAGAVTLKLPKKVNQ